MSYISEEKEAFYNNLKGNPTAWLESPCCTEFVLNGYHNDTKYVIYKDQMILNDTDPIWCICKYRDRLRNPNSLEALYIGRESNGKYYILMNLYTLVVAFRPSDNLFETALYAVDALSINYTRISAWNSFKQLKEEIQQIVHSEYAYGKLDTKKLIEYLNATQRDGSFFCPIMDLKVNGELMFTPEKIVESMEKFLADEQRDATYHIVDDDDFELVVKGRPYATWIGH